MLESMLHIWSTCCSREYDSQYLLQEEADDIAELDHDHAYMVLDIDPDGKAWRLRRRSPMSVATCSNDVRHSSQNSPPL